jgi:hypothetical protein
VAGCSDGVGKPVAGGVVGEFALHVKRHFGDARCNGERGIPGASPTTVEALSPINPKAQLRKLHPSRP